MMQQTYDTPIGIYLIVLWKSNPQLAITLPKKVCPSTNYCVVNNSDAMKLRGWLHGEFQPRLKFQSTHQAEILLQLHGKFQPRCKCFKLGWENLQEAFYVHNSSGAHAQVHTSVWAEIWMQLHEVFQPGLKLASCNRKRLFKKICSGSRAEISARLSGLKFAM